MSPKIVDKEKKSERILRAAMNVFADRGVYDFKMIDIAEAAGVGKGTLYEYFPSKKALIQGCMNLFISDFDDHIHNRMKKYKNPADKIREFTRTTIDFFVDQPNRLFLAFDYWTVIYQNRPRRKAVMESFGMFNKVIEQISQVIDEGIKAGIFKSIDSKLAASLLFSMLDILLFQYAVAGSDSLDKSTARKINQIFLEGIQK